VHLLRTGTDSVEWVAAQIGYADGATLRYCTGASSGARCAN
jgi:hypothetical protein